MLVSRRRSGSVSRAQVGLGAKRWKGGAFRAEIGLVKPFHLFAQVWKGWKGALRFLPSSGTEVLARHAHKLVLERKGGKVAPFEQQAAWLSHSTCAHRFGKVGKVRYRLPEHTKSMSSAGLQDLAQLVGVEDVLHRC